MRLHTIRDDEGPICKLGDDHIIRDIVTGRQVRPGTRKWQDIVARLYGIADGADPIKEAINRG